MEQKREKPRPKGGERDTCTVRPASGLDFVMLVSDECSVRAQQTMSRVRFRVYHLYKVPLKQAGTARTSSITYESFGSN